MNKKTVSAIAAGRKLHLVDVENLCGMGRLTRELVQAARLQYFAQVQVGADDVVVVAAGSHNKEALAFGWQDARIVFRGGTDGADLALCDEIYCSGDCSTYSEVVVASGDHIFAEPIVNLVAKGLTVTVFSRFGSLASDLRNIGAALLYARDLVLAA